MNNDLISRNELKKKFDEYITANPTISGIFELGKIIIDNAPTVEPTFGLFKEMLCGTCQAYMRIEPERPTGEWIDCGEYYKCPFCSNWILTVDGKPNYCDECGADMRGEE